MTIMGKILTLIIFFMSLVFLGFAFTVNMSNRDPQGKKTFPEALREERENRVADQKTIDGLRRELASEKAKNESLTNQPESVRTEKDKQIEQLQKQVAEERLAKDSAVAQFEQKQTEAKALEGQLEIRKQESAKKDEEIRTLSKTIADQIGEIAKLTNERLQFKVKADTYQERLTKLEADHRQLTILYENLQEGIIMRPGADPGAIAAPPDDVQGTVMKVDGQFMSINIGSDHGLRKGHEMFVFRMEPNPEYLGKIRIQEVGPHEAVGKLIVPNGTKKVKERDIVASKILGSK